MWRHTTLLALGLLSTAGVASGREWTDATGKYHTDARLLQCCNDTAWLEKPNGKLLLVPLDKLSFVDRAYVIREFPNQGVTQAHTPSPADAKAIAKSVAPAKPPEVLETARTRATIRFASYRRQQEELPEQVPEEDAAAAAPPEDAADAAAPPEDPAALPEADATAAPEEEGVTTDPVEMESNDAASTEEVAQPQAATPPEKYIYSGRCGTFHLIGEVGTGAYWYKGKHYLAMLFKAGEDANYLYYDSSHPDGQIIQWYFSKTERCCKFWVWKRTGLNEHGHYEREHRTKPN